MERRLKQWWNEAISSKDVKACVALVLAVLFWFLCSYTLADSLNLSGYAERDL